MVVTPVLHRYTMVNSPPQLALTTPVESQAALAQLTGTDGSFDATRLPSLRYYREDLHQLAKHSSLGWTGRGWLAQQQDQPVKSAC